MINTFVSREFLIFLVAGGTAAIVNFLSRLLFNQWMGFSSAIILAYLCGMTTAFILSKLFVFKNNKQSIGNSIFYFCLVNVFAIIQTWVISMLLAYKLLPFFGVTKFVPEISHLIGIVVPVFTSYLGHKRWSFAGPG
ncbi:MAG: GtrA family protein [Pseudomonadota bacterium]